MISRLFLALLLGSVLTATAQNAPPGLSISVGQTSSVQSATLTFSSSTVSGSPFTINVLKQGVSGLDFNIAAGGTCSSSATYNVGDTCTVNYTFSPLHPGIQYGAISLTLGSTALATTYIGGIGEGPQVTYLPPQQPQLGTINGGANAIAVDGAGDVFVSELFGPNAAAGAGEILEIPKGCANASCVVDYIDQSQLEALISPAGKSVASPEAVAIDGAGNLYVGFEIPPEEGFNTGLYEFPRGCTTASCAIPLGSGMYAVFAVAVDGNGNIYAASTSAGNLADWTVSRISPGCSSSSCMTPISDIYTAIVSLAADGYGDVFFTGAAQSSTQYTAFEIPNGCTESSCVVSLGSSTAYSATVDGMGNVFFTDRYSIYEIPNGCTDASCLVTLHTGYEYMAGPVMATDGAGNVYAMDDEAQAGYVFELDLVDPPTVTFPMTTQGDISPQQTVTLSNSGNQPLLFTPSTTTTNPTTSQYFQLDTTSSGTCGALISGSTTPTLAPTATCTLPISFAPFSPASGTTNGTLTLTDDNLNVTAATQTIPLTGYTALPGQTFATLSSSLNASSVGQSVTFTAHITSLSGTPTGSVTFTDGSTTLATVALDSTGSASTVDNTLTAGTHTITATYAPTGSFLASSATLSQQVNADVAVDVLTANPNPANVGSAVTLSVTVTASPVGTTPTGTVTFTSNGTNLGTVSLVGGVATYSTSALPAGTDTLGCVYSGDSTYASTNCQTVGMTVNSGTTPASITLTSSANPVAPYTSVSFTAVLTSSGQPIASDSVSLSIDGTAFSTKTTNALGTVVLPDHDGLAPGQHTITVTSSTQGTYASATASLTETVSHATSTSSLTVTPTTVSAGSAVTLTAAVEGSLNDTIDGTTLTPTGSVTFLSSGTTLSTVMLTNGTASYSTSALPVGTDNISCAYSGDSNFAPSNCNSGSVTVSTIASALTVTSSANPSPALSAVTFSASLLGGGAPLGGAAVAFAVDGINVATGITNAQGVATYTSSTLSVGQHTVTATFAGTGSYAGTQSTSLTEQIQANPTTTSLSASPNPIQQGQPLSVSVAVSATQGTSSPTGSVALVQGSTTLATATLTTATSGVISTATISISSLPAGSDSIQVNYMPADGNFEASSSSLSTVTVDVPDFSVAANPTSMSIESGQSGSSTITITSLGLFAGSAQISCGSGLPQYMSCSFTQSTVTLLANGTASSTLTINTKQAQQTASVRSGSRLNTGVLFALLLPFAFLRLKRNKDSAGRIRHLASIALGVICLGGVLVSLVGCGSSPDSTPAGTYAIPILVSGTNSGSSTSISHTLSYSVTITH